MKCPICGEKSLHLTDHECEPMMKTDPAMTDHTQSTPSVPATHSEATAEVYDAKRRRTVSVPPLAYCRICTHHGPKSLGHSIGCQLATPEDMKKEVERARKDEEWARKRAEVWLLAVRQMHGKLAMLKHQIKTLRKP